MKILITGGAGYVGTMLCLEFSKRSDVERILAIDKELFPEMLKGNNKVEFIETNLYKSDWQDKAKEFAPDVVIHTAWQIREMYGYKDVQWKWNIDGSDAVFDFVFSTSSVKKLIHFSTVASYGAFPDNTIEHRYKESEPFRVTDYLYAEEKRITEKHLEEKYANIRSSSNKPENIPQIFIVRPAAITGPRGRYSRIRFGLQSALSGQLSGSWAYSVVKMLVSFVPITEKWCRQFIHEDDVVDVVELLAFNDLKGEYEVFNICPPGDVVRGPDMAAAVNKKAVKIHPQLIRFAFFIMWHITRGKITTSKGGWKSYSYPITVDGSKLTNMYGYKYKFEPKDAFVKKEGRYMKYVI